MRTYKIHESNKSLVENNIKSLNKKFAKHNVPQITYSFSDKDESDVYTLDIEYAEVPSISGIDYKYLGMIFEEDGSKFYNGFADKEKFQNIKNMTCTCDMCKKNITNRSSFFVFENNDKISMFGSSCAKKAFPLNIDMYFGGLENLFEELEQQTAEKEYFDDGDYSVNGKMYFNIDRVISTLAEVSDDFNTWVSKDKAEMELIMSTKNKVLDILTKKNK